MSCEKKFCYSKKHIIFFITTVSSVQSFSASLNNAEDHKDFYLYVILYISYNFFCIIRLITVKDSHFFSINTSSYNLCLEKHKNDISFSKILGVFTKTIHSYNIGDSHERFNAENLRNSLTEDKYLTSEQEVNDYNIISAIKNSGLYLLIEILFNIYYIIIGRNFITSFDILCIKSTNQTELSINLLSKANLPINRFYYRIKDNQHENSKIHYAIILSNNKYLQNSLGDTKTNTYGVRSNFNNT
uniref:Omp-1-8 n=1 Tax=Ehrlichia ewingii TaxID=947 RepID=B1N6B1_9RICK|nr:Omp-1-8 [Ehrlichia ewingii]